MAAAGDGNGADGRRRKRRYRRSPEAGPTGPPTPLGLRLLRLVAQFGILSVPQLARMAGISEQAVRRQMRRLLDAGLVRVVLVPRLAFAHEGMDPAQLAFGSAPNCYQLLKPGLAALEGLGCPPGLGLLPPYGPANWLWLAHELGVRDVAAWLAAAARANGHELASFRLEPQVALPSGRAVRPDALFAYRFGGRVLVAALEYDRGTERGPANARWEEKITGYRELLQPDAFRAATGFAHGRVLVVCPSTRRAEYLAEIISRTAEGWLAGRFLLAPCGALEANDLGACSWRKPGMPGSHPLIPPDVLADATEHRA